MAKFILCGLLALLCSISCLNRIGAKELPAVDAIVEARNDEVAAPLAQPQADKLSAMPLPTKSDLSEMSVVPVDVQGVEDKKDAPIAVEQEVSAAQAEEDKKDDLVLAINAEVLKQPGMARLARELKSFHDYQVFRAQKSAGLQRAANNLEGYDDGDEEDDGIVPEERAVRRRKRVRRRNTLNNVRRRHQNRNSANRQNSARRQNQRRKYEHDEKKKSSKRVVNSKSKRRRGSSKTKKRSSHGKKRRSSKKGSRQRKRKSSQKKRTKKNSSSRRKYINEEERSFNNQANVAQAA